MLHTEVEWWQSSLYSQWKFSWAPGMLMLNLTVDQFSQLQFPLSLFMCEVLLSMTSSSNFNLLYEWMLCLMGFLYFFREHDMCFKAQRENSARELHALDGRWFMSLDKAIYRFSISAFEIRFVSNRSSYYY